MNENVRVQSDVYTIVEIPGDSAPYIISTARAEHSTLG